MAVLQTIRRGLESELPRLQIAELALTTDTDKLLIGTGSGNMVVTTLTDITITSYWNNNESSGRLYGGELSDNGDGTVRITTGAGLSKDRAATLEDIPIIYEDGQAANVAVVGWVEVVSLAIADESMSTIYYHKFSNSILATTDESEIDEVKDFILGRVYRSGTNIIIRNHGHDAYNFRKKLQAWAEDVFGIQAAIGSLRLVTNNLFVSHNGGRLWIDGNTRFTMNVFDSEGSSRFTSWYRDGAGDWTSVPDQDELDPNKYDNNSGVLQLLSDDLYTVHWVYVLHNGEVHSAYGQGNYTLLQAIDSEEPTELPGLLGAFGVLLGRVIIQKGATEAHQVDVAITHKTVFESSEVGTSSIHKYTVEQAILNDTAYNITHNLNTREVIILIKERTTGIVVDAPIRIIDENSIQIDIKNRLDVTHISITIFG